MSGTDAGLGGLGGGNPAELAPGPLTAEEMEAFFQRPLIARLAMVQPDGAPYVVPLWFQWDGEKFYFAARPKATYLPFLRREPRVCISLATEVPPYTRATVHGTAEIIDPAESGLWWQVVEEMTLRYIGHLDPGYAERTRRYPRWLIRVTPKRIVSWRGGGWHRRYTE